MKLDLFNKTTFVARCTYDERLIAKAAGFHWHPERKIWFTEDLAVAVKLRDYATVEAKRKISENLIEVSHWPFPLPQDPPGMSLFAHQREAVLFALERNRSYLALDPGLGKTAVAATLSKILKLKVVYVTPPFLVRNVLREFNTWAPSLKAVICTSKSCTLDFTGFDVLVLPDTFVSAPWTHTVLADFIGTRESMLIVDEAHRFKNHAAKRTRSLLGLSRKSGLVKLFDRQVYLSGTPMPNRPIELYPLLSTAAPETVDFMNRFQYGLKYCDGKENEHGWDFSGASNVKELASRIMAPTGPFMLRMRKDLLLDLPPKTEQVFLLSDNMPPQLAKLDHNISSSYSRTEDIIKARLEESNKEGDVCLATYRRLLGKEKAKDIIPYIASLIDDTKENVIVYAYHKEAIEVLRTELFKYKPLVITGQTPEKERHELVASFQGSSKHRMIIGNYVAMGVGFTLTRASRVIFVEYDWVPGVNDQAGDRAHRIGQDKHVLVQYVVYQGSVDEAVVNTLLQKRKATQHI